MKAKSLKFLFIVQTFCLYLGCASNATTNQTNTVLRVIFMAPADPNQEIELNSPGESILSSLKIQHGWRIEAHHEQVFYLHVVSDSVSLGDKNDKKVNLESNQASTTIIRKLRHQQLPSQVPFYSNLSNHSVQIENIWSPPVMQFYLYFTVDPNSCEDYLDHSHLPLLVEHRHQIRHGLFKIPVSFSLTHFNSPYYLCLSDGYFDLAIAGNLFSLTSFFFFFNNFFMSMQNFKIIKR